jgi:hypothetical protein
MWIGMLIVLVAVGLAFGAGYASYILGRESVVDAALADVDVEVYGHHWAVRIEHVDSAH